MNAKSGVRRSGVRARAVASAALLLAITAMLVLAATASAAPKGEYAVFSDCPLSVVGLEGCLVARTEKGEISLGKQSVPIEKTITLQGGFIEGEGGAMKFYGAADGKTLSKVGQKVPGGLAGLVNCKEITNGLERAACEFFFENALTGVTAVTELAVPASGIGLNEFNLLTESGTALKLPVKVKLENPFLGSECYVGSSASPLTLNLTTGTTSPPAPNKPITGALGTLNSRGEGGILVVEGSSLVDNAFSAPGATGCGGIFSLLVDPIINAKIGLPSAAGHNTAILKGTEEQATAEVVKNHE